MKDIKVYNTMEELDSLPSGIKTHVTLGVFDGIHLGHQALIKRVVESAKGTDALAVVFTFSNHPLNLLAPAYAPPLLTTDDVRIRIFASMGVRIAVIVKFDHDLADLPPEVFARDILFKRLKARHMVCGYNFRFGKEGSGNVDSLRNLGQKIGFSVDALAPVKIKNIDVSSTKIRELLNQGLVEQAAEFLGRPYSLCAVVEKGKGRGVQMGYPTANLSFPEGLLVPDVGVYAVWIIMEGKTYKGMMNIGYNPTFPPERFSPEVHLFDYEGSLLGKKIEVQFVKKIRDEIRFVNEKELMKQLKDDEEMIRKILDECGIRSAE